MRHQGIYGWIVAPSLLILGTSIARGQEEIEPLRLEGLYPSGAAKQRNRGLGNAPVHHREPERCGEADPHRRFLP